MSDLYGVMAVFNTPEGITKAAVHLRESGFRSFEAYTPYPIERLNKIVRPGAKPLLPILMFAAAILGAAWGYFIQYWDEALDYPINVGGRPHNSWPAFMVGTFEFMLLFTIFVGLVGMLAASRLPRLYHPTFRAKVFERASRDRFIICIEARDPFFDSFELRDVLGRLGAEQVEEVRA